MSHLYINEEELISACGIMCDHSKIVENKIREYIRILDLIKKESIVFGKLSVELQQYITYARKLQNHTTIITQKMLSIVKQYLQTVDNDDSYVF